MSYVVAGGFKFYNFKRRVRRAAQHFQYVVITKLFDAAHLHMGNNSFDYTPWLPVPDVYCKRISNIGILFVGYV
jgi:hypothetical protein